MTHIAHRAGMTLHRTMMRPLMRKPRLLLVLGVMRSGSTLLSHILMGNPRLKGFGEAHVAYTSPDALLDLAYWVFRFTGRYPRQGDYLFDKVLHGGHIPDIKQLAAFADLHVIFLLRDPATNARSLRAMFARQPSSAETDVDALLIKRYDELNLVAGALPKEVPQAVITYEDLTTDPDRPLEFLGRFLGLDVPLSRQYKVPRWSGRWGIGDGSANIALGEIKMRNQPADQTTAPVSADAASAFGRLTQTLSRTALAAHSDHRTR